MLTALRAQWEHCELAPPLARKLYDYDRTPYALAATGALPALRFRRVW